MTAENILSMANFPCHICTAMCTFSSIKAKFRCCTAVRCIKTGHHQERCHQQVRSSERKAGSMFGLCHCALLQPSVLHHPLMCLEIKTQLQTRSTSIYNINEHRSLFKEKVFIHKWEDICSPIIICH